MLLMKGLKFRRIIISSRMRCKMMVRWFISGFAERNCCNGFVSTMQQVGAQTFSSMTDMIINGQKRKLNAQDFAATFIQSVGTALLQYAAQVAMVECHRNG
jgi:hypothetical protein